MQIVVEIAQNVVDRPRAVAQLRCPETLLPSLVQALRRQQLGDTAHPSVHAKEKSWREPVAQYHKTVY